MGGRVPPSPPRGAATDETSCFKKCQEFCYFLRIRLGMVKKSMAMVKRANYVHKKMAHAYGFAHLASTTNQMHSLVFINVIIRTAVLF